MHKYGYWKPISKQSLGIFSPISERMYSMSLMDPTALPNLHASQTLFIASDYSGEHADANYQTISMIITDADAVNDWNQYRLKVRQQYLSDGRRMSFKQLRDQRRWQALVPFLSAANNIRGLSATIAIHSSIDTLFAGTNPLDLKNPDFTKFSHWNKTSLEKLFRIIRFISIFVAGMSKSGQNVLWFTDDDAIAPNVKGLTELTELFAYTASEHLEHNLGYLRVGTPARSDTNDRMLEDLIAIPDLIAGTVAEILTLQADKNELVVNVPASVYFVPEPFTTEFIQPQSKDFKVYMEGQEEIILPQAVMSAKTAFILNWLGDRGHQMKRIAAVIDPIPNSDMLSFKWLNFHSYKETH